MLLKPFINVELGTPIWRMEIDESTNTLFIENRDTANKQVSFAGIDLLNGNLNFSGLKMPERWLSGLEACNNGILVIHGFQSEVLPIHKGLTGVNGLNGVILWTNYNINFEKITEIGFVVSDTRIQPKKLFFIDIKTGERINSYEPTNSDTVTTSVIYPETIPPAALPYGLLKAETYGDEVHYLCQNKFRIVSLHALNQGELTQHLYVWGDDDQLVFEDIIASQIQKLQPEAFISYKNKLIWLKNRSTVKVLNL